MIPDWLKKMVARNKAALHKNDAARTCGVLDGGKLNTVCDSAQCPNKGECFSKGDATFMILGENCTRGCRFCAVGRGCPAPVDSSEAARIADAVKRMNIKYVVLTSPTRDDLPDGGASHFAAVIRTIKETNPAVLVEPLIPDFAGNIESLKTVLAAGPVVLAHNIETVPSLYSQARSGADYARSLKILRESKNIAPDIFTKSGIMLGLGESTEELKQTIKDLARNKCDLLTLGQYLAPSDKHNIVKRYPPPEEYEELKVFALAAGFKGVAAGPLVRSSYKAGDLYRAAKNYI